MLPATITSKKRLINLLYQVKRNSLMIAVLTFLLALILLPMIRLIFSSFRLGSPAMPAEGWSVIKYVEALSSPLFYETLGTTLVFGICATIMTLAIALLFAWLIERTDMPLRNLAWVLLLIPMAIPGILFALSWMLLLGPRAGVINVWLRQLLEFFDIHLTTGPLNIYSLPGLIFLDGLRGVTTVFLMVVGAFRMMDPALEEAARVAKASRITTLFTVTLPVLLPAIMLATMYRFIHTMESFEIPLAIGVPAHIFVLATLIYFSARLRMPPDYTLSAVYAVIFMVIMIFLIVFYRYGLRYFKNYATVTGKGYRPRVLPLGKWRYPALGLFILFFLITVVAPFAILLWNSLLPGIRPISMEALKEASLKNYIGVFTDSDVLEVIWNTVKLVLTTSTVTMFLALCVSWTIIRTALRGRGILDTLMFLPYSIPGIVIAFALGILFLTPPFNVTNLYGSLWIVCMGLLIHFIAFGTRLMNGAIIQIHKELEEAALVSKASAFKTIFVITLPLLFPAFAAGWIWVSVHAFRSFSLPLMLSGKKNRVISVVLWEYWNNGDVTITAALGVLLILLLIPMTFFLRKFMVQVRGEEK